MKFFLQVSLCCLLAGGTAVAQRGGGGARGAGYGGMGSGGPRVVGGNSFGTGFRGGFNNGFRGGFGTGFRGRGNSGFLGGFGGAGLWGWGGGWWWPDLAYDPFFDYWPYSYYGSGYSPYVGAYPYVGGNPYGYGYAEYQSSPNVTVVYPAAQQATVQTAQTQPVRPVIHEYDQNGQEIRPGTAPNQSPIYLIAFNDHIIRAAMSYRVEGKTLHYVTLEREDKEAPLGTVDRDLSLRLNRERQVPFQLPSQQ